MKTCSKCHVERDSHDFGKRAAAPDGLREVCLICSRELKSMKNPSPDDYFIKECCVCKQKKKYLEFYRLAISADGRQPSCKSCQSVRLKTKKEATHASGRAHSDHTPNTERDMGQQVAVVSVHMKREVLGYLDQALERMNEPRGGLDYLTRADLIRYAIEKYLRTTFF